MRQKKMCLLLLLLTAVASLVSSCIPAYAATVSTAEFESAVMDMYRLILGVSGAMAVVGIAFSGIAMLLGSEKDADKARSAIKYVIIAFIGLLLLPAIVRAGRSLFG